MQRTERMSSALLRLSPDGSLRRLKWKVSVVAGPDAGLTVELTEPLIVGGGAGVGLQLKDPAVSRQHVQLEPRADGVHVRDLGSTNGTMIGGARMESALVENQAVISLGRTRLSVSLTDEVVDESEGPTELEGLVAQSAVMRKLFGLITKLAPTDTPVILLGETGTGKEGLARAVHLRSHRKQGPLVVLDCSSISPQLIESELFGHAKGAFTGASSERPGAFLEAEGGTLFLDEVGELPLDLQPRLLRALEARQVKRVGEDRYRSVDVRIVAATHRDLDAESKAGRFRRDLYFRLAVAALRVPPLRERREDIPLLVQSMLEKLGREGFSLSQELQSRLASYEWPGNVRELRNVVARAVISDAVSLDSVLNPAETSPSSERETPGLDLPFKQAKEKLVDGFTREYLVNLHAKCEGNVSKMARTSGLARTYLHELLGKYGLRGD